MAVVLGFDGGGTRSEAILLSGQGRVLGHGTGGTAHEWYGQGHLVEGSVRDALATALPADALRPDLAVLTGPSGGRVSEVLQEAIGPSTLLRASEAECFLASSLRTTGMVVLAGTGSFVYGRARDGRWISAGGAGPVIGDHGSGFDLGLRAIRATCLAAQLHPYRSPLTDAVLEAFECERRWDLVTLYHTNPPSRLGIAALAPIVTRHAEEGDPVALQILDEAAHELSTLAAGVLEELGIYREETVILAGGAAESTAYQEALRRHLAPLFAGPVDICRPKYRPAVGAAFVGLKYLGVEWSEELIAALDSDLAAWGLAGAAKE